MLGVVLLVVSVWEIMGVGAQDASGPYCSPRRSPRLGFPVLGSTGAFSCGTVLLEGSGSFGVIFGLEFIRFLVNSLGDSLGWRKAVSRMAAPRDPAADRRCPPAEGAVPGPSGDA
jgi:hypothetical protein